MSIQRRGGSYDVYVYDPHVGRKRYIGRRRDEADAQTLFDETTLAYKGRVKGPGQQATGAAAEHRAIAELLERGHPVAKPVVDNDGVDLVIDYHIKAQIKSSTTLEKTRAYSETKPCRRRHENTGYPLFNMGPSRNADVYLLYDARQTARTFYVVPAAAMPKGTTLTLTPKYHAYREAWDTIPSIPCTYEQAEPDGQ